MKMRSWLISCLLGVALTSAVFEATLGEEKKKSVQQVDDGEQDTPTVQQDKLAVQQLVRASGPHFEIPTPIDFEDFQKIFHKHYGTLAEEVRRKSIFIGKYVAARWTQMAYQLGLRDTFYGINEMSDWTEDDWKQLRPPKREAEGHTLSDHDRQLIANGTDPSLLEYTYGWFGKKKSKKNGASSSSTGDASTSYEDPYSSYGGRMSLAEAEERLRSSGSNPPVNIDLRTTNCFNSVQKQGRCGCCYAFSTIAVFEYMYCRYNNQRVKFSEQFVVDCSVGQFGNSGCNGGTAINTIRFLHVMGLEYASGRGRDYVARQKECNTNNPTAHYRPGTDGFHALAQSSWQDWLEARVPIIVNLRANWNGFAQYRGGIDSPYCDQGDESHSIVLVGMGQDVLSTYYIFRNSYGTSWGQSGHYYIRSNSPCLDDTGLIPEGFASGQGGLERFR